MTHPRDVYLAWQADIGTEDVVLAQPWSRPRPAAPMEPRPGFASPPEPRFESAPRDREPAFAPAEPAASTPPVSGENFFQSVAAMLAKPERATRAARAPRPAEPPPAPVVSEIPEFRDLEAYWNFLDATYPKWYPGAARPVRAEGAPRPALAVVELSPGNGAGSGDRVFSGEAGALLDRMLKAIGLERDRLYLTALMKTPPPGKAWSRRDAARMLPAFLKELRLAQCGLVLLLGENCAQIVMRTGQGLAALGERAVNAEDLAFTATWHPDDLLKNEALKRDAWTHLKWLQTRLPAVGG